MEAYEINDFFYVKLNLMVYTLWNIMMIGQLKY